MRNQKPTTDLCLQLFQSTNAHSFTAFGNEPRISNFYELMFVCLSFQKKHPSSLIFFVES